jgi:anti-sigma B factor antagonist
MDVDGTDGGHPPTVEIEIEVVAGADNGGETVVRVRGELDLATAPQLERALRLLLEESPPAVLVFDLARLDFMDSTGIAALLRAAVVVKSTWLRSPSPIVREIVRLSGLTEVLRIEE